jgi:Tfp pilus assembly protein PilF
MKVSNQTIAEQFFLTGVASMEKSEFPAAEEAFRCALQHAPLAEAHANIGILLENRAEVLGAESHYRQSIELNPNYAETHSNLGNLLAGQKRFAEAEASHREAIALNAASPASLSNLGVLLASLWRDDESEQCYRTALSHQPDYRKAIFNLSYLLLRQGRFSEGWDCLEARSSNRNLTKELDFPRWEGESLQEKSLLVIHEGGLGDTIHFCRYLPILKRMGTSRITLICHPAMKQLLSTLEGVDEVISGDEQVELDGHDSWIFLLSIPCLLGTDIDSIPCQLPYLYPLSERQKKWKHPLSSPGFKVGLVWRGNPAHENDAERSLPSLACLAPLVAIPGVSYFSLQKGAGESEAKNPPANFPLLHLGKEITDFADTAAIISHLDLVISVDTATAHLAGALGKPCWILLPYHKPDWRWLMHRGDTPWYPGIVSLFRQPSLGAWAPVVEEVCNKLRLLQ